ncbi:dihydrofolate reductase family protein [Streptomyces sp. NPDC090022]|uniref:dihydrofolate reductase family protein n=1 Tax=Streptomyces sp. NPDC090022 TaxID=3365920 RepID=UPI00383004FF
MRRIVLMAQVSIDGFIEAPGRDISWHRVDAELHAHMNEVTRDAGGILSGRVTHELMASYWPTADQDPDVSPVEAEFAEIWRTKPKWVFSRTLRAADWNTTVLGEVDPRQIAALKAEPGGDLALSGANLAASFLAQDLVDAYRIYVHPVRVGRGTPLFPGTPVTSPLPLELVETRTFGNGVVLLHHRRA